MVSINFMTNDSSTTALFSSGCLICGADLVYAVQTREAHCALCQRQFSVSAACAQGHFVCDNCHGLQAFDWIERACLASHETDPLRLAESLMRHPAVKMHGPEHHFLVAAALLTSWSEVHDDPAKAEKLTLARKRADDIKGGFCGSHGTCGAAMGAGVASSILTGATPLSKEGWSLANLTTAACLTAIGAAGGPRCCKRDTYLALQTGRDFLNKYLGAEYPKGLQPVCSFSIGNRECITDKCPFFGQRPN